MNILKSIYFFLISLPILVEQKTGIKYPFLTIVIVFLAQVISIITHSLHVFGWINRNVCIFILRACSVISSFFSLVYQTILLVKLIAANTLLAFINAYLFLATGVFNKYSAQTMFVSFLFSTIIISYFAYQGESFDLVCSMSVFMFHYIIFGAFLPSVGQWVVDITPKISAFNVLFPTPQSSITDAKLSFQLTISSHLLSLTNSYFVFSTQTGIIQILTLIILVFHLFFLSQALKHCKEQTIFVNYYVLGPLEVLRVIRMVWVLS